MRLWWLYMQQYNTFPVTCNGSFGYIVARSSQWTSKPLLESTITEPWGWNVSTPYHNAVQQILCRRRVSPMGEMGSHILTTINV